jgi:hypothetical protein
LGGAGSGERGWGERGAGSGVGRSGEGRRAHSRRICSRTCMPFIPCIITSQSTRLNCSLGGMTTFSRSSCRLSSPQPAHCRRAQTGERGWGGWRRLGVES